LGHAQEPASRIEERGIASALLTRVGAVSCMRANDGARDEPVARR
jgi:hypothetical protein